MEKIFLTLYLGVSLPKITHVVKTKDAETLMRSRFVWILTFRFYYLIII
jgi:hypothetical protein